MADCDNNCAACGVSDCGKRTEIKKLVPHEGTEIKKIYAVISGKGGVGKSLVTSLLASALTKKGKKAAIMDADITGPSIPQAFGLKDAMATQDDSGLYGCKSKLGIKVMSINLLLEHNEDPIIWRGPIISGFVQQLFTDVNYGKLDYMLIDMPPGTGDVPLTVFQSLPIDGIIVVSSPQELVSMVVQKSINMANMMNIPILGMVMNMSYVKCPHCGERIEVFNHKEGADYPLPLLAELPIDPLISKLVDEGNIEDYPSDIFESVVNALE